MRVNRQFRHRLGCYTCITMVKDFCYGRQRIDGDRWRLPHPGFIELCQWWGGRFRLGPFKEFRQRRGFLDAFVVSTALDLFQVLFSCCTMFFVQIIGSTVYISDYGMSKMIELSTKPPYCVIQRDRGKIRDMLLSTDPRRVRQMSDESIEDLEEACNTEQIHSPHQGGFLYPGTKWCGPGNRAVSETDFGFHMKEDMCCREHDRCPKALGRGECRQGICNNSRFTRSHCDCDAAFRKCLQNVNSETANTIGAIFFNIIQVICFKERTPCTQWQSFSSQSNYNENCPLYFENSERYRGNFARTHQFGQKKARFVNNLLRKFGYL